jgi:hypothetical protein
VIALDDDNKEEIVRLMKLAGFRSRRMDPGMYSKCATRLVFADRCFVRCDLPLRKGGL